MPFCPNCGAETAPEANFCPKCGRDLAIVKERAAPVSSFLLTTTPTMPGYKVKKVLGIVTGITARTRGVGGKIVAGIQSVFGGEVSAFTSEMEKAKAEAIERAKRKAIRMGANALIGVDFETSEIFQGVVLISATATAVLLEPE